MTLFTSLLAALAAASVHSGPTATVKPVTHPARVVAASDDDSGLEFVILDLTWSGRRLQNDISAYENKKGQLLIPFGQTAVALGFRVQVDAQKEIANGFLFAPSDRVAIDFHKGEIRRGKTLAHFNPADCSWRPDGFYIDSQLFASLTGVACKWHADSLALEIVSKKALPIEAERMMENRSTSIDVVAPGQADPIHATVPYKLWAVPTMDVNVNTRTSDIYNQSQSNSQLEVDGTGDLLDMGGRYRMISDSGGKVNAVLLSLERTDQNNNLLGPLHASRVEIGQVNPDPAPLLARSRTGVGLSVGNAPVLQRANTVTLTGGAPAGSVVEVYKADKLVASAQSDSTGQYEFKSFPLNQGPNRLQIVVTSPGGQVQQTNRILYGDLSAPPKGKTIYRLTAAESPELPASGDIGGSFRTKQAFGYVAEADRALSANNWLSLSAAKPSGQSPYLGLGLNSWQAGNLFNMNVAASSSGGIGTSVGVDSHLKRGSLLLQQTFFSKPFRSDLTGKFGPGVSAVTSLELDGWARAFNRPVSYGFNADRGTGLQNTTRLRFRVSGGSNGIYATNILQMNTGNGATEIGGFFNVDKQLGLTTANLEVGYSLKQTSFLQRANFSLQRNISKDYRASTGLLFQADHSKPLSLNTAIYRMLGPVGAGVNVAVGQTGKVQLSLQLSTSLSQSSGNAFSSPGSTESGIIAARVFLDNNDSGKYDKGDTLLQNVDVTVNGHAAGLTRKDGTCLLRNLSIREEQTVSVDETSLPDPFMLCASPSIIITPRAGFSGHFDFAIVSGAEIDGKVIVPDNDDSDRSVQLLGKGDKIIETSIVDLDNQYVFSRVQPGSYKVRLVDTAGTVLFERPLNVTQGGKQQQEDLGEPHKAA